MRCFEGLPLISPRRICREKTVPLVREMASTGARVRVRWGPGPWSTHKGVPQVARRTGLRPRSWRNKLVDLHEEDLTLGCRYLKDESEHEGVDCSEYRVHRLCRIGGLWSSHMKKNGEAGRLGPPVHDDLLAAEDEHGRTRHRFSATVPNQVRLTEITGHPTRQESLRLCAVKDMSRTGSLVTRSTSESSRCSRPGRSSTRSPSVTPKARYANPNTTADATNAVSAGSPRSDTNQFICPPWRVENHQAPSEQPNSG